VNEHQRKTNRRGQCLNIALRFVILSLSKDQTHVACQNRQKILTRLEGEISAVPGKEMCLILRQAQDDGLGSSHSALKTVQAMILKTTA
jgi:hypothetical protein